MLKLQKNKLEFKFVDDDSVEQYQIELGTDDTIYKLSNLFETLQYIFDHNYKVKFHNKKLSSVKEVKGILMKYLPLDEIPY